MYFFLYFQDSDSDSSVDSSDIDSELITQRLFSLVDGMKHSDLIGYSSNQR